MSPGQRCVHRPGVLRYWFREGNILWEMYRGRCPGGQKSLVGKSATILVEIPQMQSRRLCQFAFKKRRRRQNAAWYNIVFGTSDLCFKSMQCSLWLLVVMCAKILWCANFCPIWQKCVRTECMCKYKLETVYDDFTTAQPIMSWLIKLHWHVLICKRHVWQSLAIVV